MPSPYLRERKGQYLTKQSTSATFDIERPQVLFFVRKLCKNGGAWI